MATYKSEQLTDGFRKYPIDDHGKLRTQHFRIPALTVAYAQNDQVDLFKIPPGRIRHLPWLSRIWSSAWGASRTIDIGYRAYSVRPPDVAQEVEDGDAFIDGLDVSSAVNNTVWGATPPKYDMYSRTEVTVFLTILGGTMPIGGTLEGFFAYLYE